MTTLAVRPRVIAIALAVVVVASVAALGLTRVQVRTSLDSFLPAGDPELTAYQHFGDAFGAEPVVVMLETDAPGGQVLDTGRMEALLRLEGELSQLPGVVSVYGPATLLNQVAKQAKDLLAELMGRRDAEIAAARLRAKDAGAGPAAVREAGARVETAFDARYGPVLVQGMPGGLPTLRNQRFIDSVVFDGSGGPRGQWRFLVPGRSSVAILVRPSADLDAQQTASLVDAIERVGGKQVVPGTHTTITGTPVMVTALSRRATGEAPLLVALAIGGLALCLAGGAWIRRSRRFAPLAVTCASVTLALAGFGLAGRPVTLGIVAFCPVLLGIGSYYPTYFTTGARRRTVLTVALASALSLGSLALSPMPLVRDIGLFLAVGVVGCVLLSLALRPWLAAGAAPAARSASARPTPSVAGTSIGRARALVAVLLVAGAAGWALEPSIPVSADVEHFAGGMPELAQARHVEDVLGSSGEVDIVLHGIDTLSPSALRWMRTVSDRLTIQHGDLLRPVVSPPALLAFLGADPTREQIDAATRLLPTYLTGSVTSPDRSTAVMVYGVRLDDITRLGSVRAELLRSLPPPPPGDEVQVVGLPLVLVQGEQTLSADRLAPSLLGILAAGLVLLIGLRRRSDAVRAVLAAGIATGGGFLLLHLTGRALDPVTVGLGALTVAVGAEFTVVRAEAARSGRADLVRTVALVALTSAAGYLALLGSHLVVVRDFGLDLAVTVALAYVSSAAVVGASVRRRPDAGTSSLPPAPATTVKEPVHV